MDRSNCSGSASGYATVARYVTMKVIDMTIGRKRKRDEDIRKQIYNKQREASPNLGRRERKYGSQSEFVTREW